MTKNVYVRDFRNATRVKFQIQVNYLKTAIYVVACNAEKCRKVRLQIIEIRDFVLLAIKKRQFGVHKTLIRNIFDEFAGILTYSKLFHAKFVKRLFLWRLFYDFFRNHIFFSTLSKPEYPECLSDSKTALYVANQLAPRSTDTALYLVKKSSDTALYLVKNSSELNRRFDDRLLPCWNRETYPVWFRLWISLTDWNRQILKKSAKLNHLWLMNWPYNQKPSNFPIPETWPKKVSIIFKLMSRLVDKKITHSYYSSLISSQCLKLETAYWYLPSIL